MIKHLLATAGVGLALGSPFLLTTSDGPLHQEVVSKDCGTATLKFTNDHDGYTYTWNVHASDGQNILVPVSSADSPVEHTVKVAEDSGSGWISYGVVSGAESDYYLKFQTLGLDTDCLPPPSPEPTPTTGPQPTTEPEPTPTAEPAPSTSPSVAPSSSPSPDCVDLNRDPAGELVKLKNVDQTTAALIIAARPINSESELSQVKGLGGQGIERGQLLRGDDNHPRACPFPAPGAGGGLPVTGAGVAGIALGGATILGTGAGLYFLTRKRRTRFTA